MGEVKKTHQALYRTHRPKSLKEVIGQEHVTRTLANAINQGKISHAYLFTGPRGVGKTSIARILAHQINKLPYEDDRPHLDIIEIDAASNRRIDDIRDLREKVNIAPVSAKYKVYIIDEVHMLTTESFNALLKTLEEPPEHVVFILATTEVHKLPATIISRTQRHSFHSLPVEQMTDYLRVIADKENIEIDNEALGLVAARGDGSFRDSISILDQLSGGHAAIDRQTVEMMLGIAPQDQFSQLLGVLKSGDTGQVLSITDDLAKLGLTPSGIAAQLLSSFRQKVASSEGDQAMVALMKDLVGVNTSPFAKLALETALLEYCFANRAESREQRAENKTLEPQTKEETKSTSSKKQRTEILQVASTRGTTASDRAKNDQLTANGNEAEYQARVAERDTSQAASTSKFQTLNSNIDLESEWPNILSHIKKANNSLYTVLRLARPTIDENMLELAFRFPFHQKRAEDSKNKAIIASIFSENYGTSLEVVAIIDESISASSPEITESASEPSATFPDSEIPDSKLDIRNSSNTAQASLVDNVRDIMGGGEVIDG